MCRSEQSPFQARVVFQECLPVRRIVRTSVASPLLQVDPSRRSRWQTRYIVFREPYARFRQPNKGCVHLRCIFELDTEDNENAPG